MSTVKNAYVFLTVYAETLDAATGKKVTNLAVGASCSLGYVLPDGGMSLSTAYTTNSEGKTQIGISFPLDINSLTCSAFYDSFEASQIIDVTGNDKYSGDITLTVQTV